MLLLCTYFKSSSPSHTKNTLFLFFFSFSLSKGHSLGFEIRKKNLGYQNLKMSSSSSKSAFETSHFISRRKEGQRANTPGFLSRPPTQRPSRSSRLVELLSSSSSSFFVPGGRSLWWSFSKSSSQVSKVSLFVSGAISLFNLSREKKI